MTKEQKNISIPLIISLPPIIPPECMCSYLFATEEFHIVCRGQVAIKVLEFSVSQTLAVVIA